MQCESHFLKPFIALSRARTLAAALLVFAVFIGALGAAVPAMQAQQAVAAPAGSLKAAPPPKAETPPPAESSTQILAHIANSGLPERGAHNAKVTIIFFDDFQCPYSAKLYQTLFDGVMKDYGDRVRVMIEPVPNNRIHPWAKRASINASCLAVHSTDAYWDFADYVHAHQEEIQTNASDLLDKLAREQVRKHELPVILVEECIETQSDVALESSRRQAIYHLGIHQVPTIFINGEKRVGPLSPEALRSAIDDALKSTDGPRSAPSTGASAGLSPAKSRLRPWTSSSSFQIGFFASNGWRRWRAHQPARAVAEENTPATLKRLTGLLAQP